MSVIRVHYLSCSTATYNLIPVTINQDLRKISLFKGEKFCFVLSINRALLHHSSELVH